MKKIKLTQGKYCLVSDEDFKELSKFKWYARKCRNTFYAQRKFKIKGEWKNIMMHRYIMNPPNDKFIDHIDRDGLNNQRSNLRIVTHSQNHFNERIRSDNTSGVKGVYNKTSHNGKYSYWVAVIGGKYLGQFKKFNDACKCREEAFSKLDIYKD